MKLDAKKYDEMRKAASPPSPLLKDCLWAFFVGGAICLLGEGLRMLYAALGFTLTDAGTLTSATLIGLSAKNAILIVEFARQLHREGQPLLAATIHAASQRLRPILMTSLAFTLGVVPLMLATGASDSTQHAIGTGVFGGMISGTLLAIFFVPVFFIVIARFIGNIRKA